MIDRWANRDVDLGLLSENVKRFFDEKQFPSRVEERSRKEFLIIAVPRRVSGANLTGSVRVAVRGNPDDFEVEFAVDSHSRHLARLSGLATLLGGGALLLKDLRSSEAFEKLEKDFWLFIDRQVDSLGRRKDGK